MSNEELTAMADKTILRAAMKERGMTQMILSDKLGIKQSSLSGNMNRTRMGLDVFLKILNAMDYDVTVIDRETGEIKWKVEA